MASATWDPDVAEVAVPDTEVVVGAKTLTAVLPAKLGAIPATTNIAAARTAR
jgi:hypothetical protein